MPSYRHTRLFSPAMATAATRNNAAGTILGFEN